MTILPKDLEKLVNEFNNDEEIVECWDCGDRDLSSTKTYCDDCEEYYCEDDNCDCCKCERYDCDNCCESTHMDCMHGLKQYDGDRLNVCNDCINSDNLDFRLKMTPEKIKEVKYGYDYKNDGVYDIFNCKNTYNEDYGVIEEKYSDDIFERETRLVDDEDKIGMTCCRCDCICKEEVEEEESDDESDNKSDDESDDESDNKSDNVLDEDTDLYYITDDGEKNIVICENCVNFNLHYC